jgi:phospholipase C
MSQATIEHVVVLMLENRSFDHLLGLVPNRQINGLLGADGVTVKQISNVVTRKAAPPLAVAVQAGAQYTIDEEQIDSQGIGGPSHSFPGATLQLFNNNVAPANPADARMSGFAQSYYNLLQSDLHMSNPTEAEVAVPMSAFQAGQLPAIWQLAQQFCVCDNWFSEVPGPTQPNRLFVHAATSAGFVHNVWDQPFKTPTIYDALDKAGRDWAVFYFDLRDTDSFPQVKKRVNRVLPFASFQAQAGSGTLPSYSFLCPRYNEPKEPGGAPPNSEHAPYDVRNGENLIADVYDALRTGPGWLQTLLIVTYDEHGGYYDHVPPPAANVANPDGLTSPTAVDKQAAAKSAKNKYLLGPDYAFDFSRLGLRVPAVLVSPWIAPGSVISQQLQHTSILATLRELYGAGTLTKRDAQAASFASALSLAAPRSDTPVKLNRPPLIPSTAQDALAPLTQQQSEMWPLLSQLDGHPDSGKVVVEPSTRAEAARYIAERIAAHNLFHRRRRRKARYAVSRNTAGLYTWTLLDEAGRPVAASARSYRNRATAEKAISRVRDLGPFAREVDGAQAKVRPVARRRRKRRT